MEDPRSIGIEANPLLTFGILHPHANRRFGRISEHYDRLRAAGHPPHSFLNRRAVITTAGERNIHASDLAEFQDDLRARF